MTAEQNQEIKIAVLEAKVDHLIGHVKELTLRVRANEKVVASVSLLGVIACTFIGAGYFAPKADAEVNDQSFTDSFRDEFPIAHMGHSFPTGEWIEKLRNWESRRKRTQPDDAINKALEDMEFEYGSDDTTVTEELLQLPSDRDQPSFRW